MAVCRRLNLARAPRGLPFFAHFSGFAAFPFLFSPAFSPAFLSATPFPATSAFGPRADDFAVWP